MVFLLATSALDGCDQLHEPATLLPDACISVPVRTLGGSTRKSLTFRYFRLPTFFWDVTQHSFAVTDVSGKPVVPVKGTDMLSRNVGN